MHKGCVLWFTGLSGAGKSAVSQLVAERLRAQRARVEVLDGDEVRRYLSKGLGFSKEDRDENIRRIGLVCQLLARNGVIAIAAAISPYRAVREELRAVIPNFVEVYAECPLEVLIERDIKGLYRRALAGEITQFTGVSDPYEPPLAPEVTIYSSLETPGDSADRVCAELERLGVISPAHFGSGKNQPRAEYFGPFLTHRARCWEAGLPWSGPRTVTFSRPRGLRQELR